MDSMAYSLIVSSTRWSIAFTMYSLLFSSKFRLHFLPQPVAYVGVVCYPLYDVLVRHQIDRDFSTTIKTITQIFSSNFYFNIFQRHRLCCSYSLFVLIFLVWSTYVIELLLEYLCIHVIIYNESDCL